eukprot:jgi/Chlat1/6778/Chrsp50S06452
MAGAASSNDHNNNNHNCAKRAGTNLHLAMLPVGGGSGGLSSVSSCVFSLSSLSLSASCSCSCSYAYSYSRCWRRGPLLLAPLRARLGGRWQRPYCSVSSRKSDDWCKKLVVMMEGGGASASTSQSSSKAAADTLQRVKLNDENENIVSEASDLTVISAHVVDEASNNNRNHGENAATVAARAVEAETGYRREEGEVALIAQSSKPVNVSTWLVRSRRPPRSTAGDTRVEWTWSTPEVVSGMAATLLNQDWPDISETAREATTALKLDGQSGARQMAAKLLDIIHHLTDKSPTSLHLYVDVHAVAAARPAMAPLAAVARRVLEADGVVDIDGARGMTALERQRVKERVEAVRRELRESGERVARHGVDLIKGMKKVATLSYSSSLEAAFQLLATEHRDSMPEVIVSVSRPGGEGKRVAGLLRGWGYKTTLVSDTAFFSALTTCDALLLGADCVFVGDSADNAGGATGAWTRVANKVGSAPAALWAHTHGVPTFVLADTFKAQPYAELFHPESIKGDEEGEAECPLFEVVQGEWVTRVVCEYGDWRKA